MGLVKCSKCSNLYDYDKYNGICPKCARYNKETTAAEEHQAYHDKYDGGYAHTAQDNHHSYHQRYDENKDPHGSRKTGKIILGIAFGVLLLCLLPFFGPFVLIAALLAFNAWKKKK